MFNLSKDSKDNQHYWLGLTIGNSRLHWGLFQNQNLIKFGDEPHLSSQNDRHSLLQAILDFLAWENLDIYLASVVPQQTKLWLDYAGLTLITLQDIPLDNLYPTMGIDRALAVFGAGSKYGFPCLVIDGGTALTFTGVNSQQQLVGGAILPGLRSQLTSLRQKTAALPEISLPASLPIRWALDTQDAIASGVIYTAIAGMVGFINDWCSQFPHSKVIITGGDGDLLYNYLPKDRQILTSTITVDPHLIFWGIRSVKNQE